MYMYMYGDTVQRGLLLVHHMYMYSNKPHAYMYNTYKYTTCTCTIHILHVLRIVVIVFVPFSLVVLTVEMLILVRAVN